MPSQRTATRFMLRPIFLISKLGRADLLGDAIGEGTKLVPLEDARANNFVQGCNNEKSNVPQKLDVS